MHASRFATGTKNPTEIRSRFLNRKETFKTRREREAIIWISEIFRDRREGVFRPVAFYVRQISLFFCPSIFGPRQFFKVQEEKKACFVGPFQMGKVLGKSVERVINL